MKSTTDDPRQPVPGSVGGAMRHANGGAYNGDTAPVGGGPGHASEDSDSIRQFDPSVKDFMFYELVLLLQTTLADGKIVTTEQKLADVLVAANAHGSYAANTEYWYFYHAGVKQLGNAERVEMKGGEPQDWAALIDHLKPVADGLRADKAAELPSYVAYSDSAGEPPCDAVEAARRWFECAYAHKRVQVQFQIRKQGESYTGSMTWRRSDIYSDPIMKPRLELSFASPKEDVPAVEWYHWRGEF